MYSPKIKEQFIPILYKLKQKTGKSMTKIVNEAIGEYLEKEITGIIDEGSFRLYKETKKGNK